jgi:hypothetical protein
MHLIVFEFGMAGLVLVLNSGSLVG